MSSLRIVLHRTSRCAVLLPILWSALGPQPARAAEPAVKVDVTTYHNNLGRTGENLKETVLTPALLRGEIPGKRFRKLWSVPVDGQVYAQPLCLCDVPVPVTGRGEGARALKDLVIVATQHNSVYALDAQRPGPPVWHWSGITAALGPVPTARFEPGKTNLLHSYDIVPEVGITGTPVIDPGTRRIYVVTKSRAKDPAAPAAERYVQRIHCLDAATGRELRSRIITATCRGSGDGMDDTKPAGSAADLEAMRQYAEDAGYDPELGTNDGGHRIRFLPKCQNQRPGLLLLDGVVYVGWSSHGDVGAFHGWLIGYDAETLEQVSVFNVTPSGYEGSIWQGGAAPAADELGNIYLCTGNGSFNARGALFGPETSFANCVLKISTRDRTLRVIDYFSPFNRDCLNGRDLDLGSGGVILLPKRPGDPRLLLITAGKEGTIFLIDREHMGQQVLKDADHVVRRLTSAIGEKYGLGAYFDGSVYYGGGSFIASEGQPPGPSPIHKLSLSKALAQSRPEFDASTHRPGGTVVFKHKGVTPCISANGKADAILWALRCDGGNEATRQEIDDEARHGHVIPPAVLQAFDARTLELLWGSDETPDARNTPPLGDRIKFAVPTIANGKVFVGTGRSPDGAHAGELNVFGVAE
jgi:hypothetical protein